MLQATLNFPNRFSGLEGWELPSAFSIKPLPVHSMGSFHAQYWLCSVGNQFCPLPLGWTTAGPHRFQELLPALLIKWSRRHSTAGVAMAPSWALGKPWDSRAGKTPHLRIQIRQICTPTSFLVTVCPRLGLADKQSP